MTTSTPTAPTAQAHGRFIRGSVSKVRRVLDQIRGRTYRDALIMLEFMPLIQQNGWTRIMTDTGIISTYSPTIRENGSIQTMIV